MIKAYSTVGPNSGTCYGGYCRSHRFSSNWHYSIEAYTKFGKGKKDRYQGLGEVGEVGSELIESNGQMFITKKPTIVWLGAKDKVYNPKETKAMMNRNLPVINNTVALKDPGNKSSQNIDYDRLGKAVGKHASFSLNIDGYKTWVKEQQLFTTYLNKRRGY